MKAMIFAAGLGTRLKPFTDNHPKALAIVNNKTLLQRNIEYLKNFGFTEFVLNVHHFPDQIISFLRKHHNFGCKIIISDETDALLETGGGLKKASPYLKGQEAFLVMNVDMLTNLNIGSMIAFHQSNKSLATLAVTGRTTSRYFLFNDRNELCGWKNTRTNEEKIIRKEAGLIPKAFSGIHIIDPAIFDHIKREGKFSMVDVYLELCATNKISGFDHTSDILIDVGKPESIAEAEALFT
ncbi:MAG TPA: nucleotidyltransferase family protein [Cytophagaceae bacterium]|jgi:MurNAc alpha-1-phosphate uridylyltransferase|nr:nucleotidyltransferase family protein [Cytophagaceae bacterium]